MKKGFTLIELIVVIAIIAILTGVVLATIGNVPSSSLQTGIPAKSTYPEPTGYVVDTADIISPEIETQLTEKLKVEDSTAQIAVVTVKTTGMESIEEYSIHLADQWKVGHKGADNGIIFLIASSDRKMRIEVGRGLEGDLNDAKTGAILKDVVTPYFKAGDWNGGVVAGVDEIIKVIKN